MLSRISKCLLVLVAGLGLATLSPAPIYDPKASGGGLVAHPSDGLSYNGVQNIVGRVPDRIVESPSPTVANTSGRSAANVASAAATVDQSRASAVVVGAEANLAAPNRGNTIPIGVGLLCLGYVLVVLVRKWLDSHIVVPPSVR